MRIADIYKEKKNVLSFEIFPPKKDDELKNIDATLEILCELNPDYISVTFGAGGSSNNNKTIDLAKKIKHEYHVEPVVHLTCLCYDKQEIDEFAKVLQAEGIENVLALRGDRNPNLPEKPDFKYASNLVKHLNANYDFCIAALVGRLSVDNYQRLQVFEGQCTGGGMERPGFIGPLERYV